MDFDHRYSGRRSARQGIVLEEGEDFWLLETQKKFLTTEACIISKKGHCDGCGYKGHGRMSCPMTILCASLLISFLK
jgi:hypothetical protein